MLCQNCGKELSEGAVFCTECGVKVAENVTTEAKPNAEGTEEIILSVDGRMGKRKETLREKYLSFHGRLNRKRYILRSLALVAALVIVQIVICLLVVGIYICAEQLNCVELIDVNHIPPTFYMIDYVLEAVFSVVNLTLGMSLMVRRLHDLNRSGFLALFNYVLSIVFFVLGVEFSLFFWFIGLLVGLSFAIYLIFFKGTKGDNKYGPDPLAK